MGSGGGRIPWGHEAFTGDYGSGSFAFRRLAIFVIIRQKIAILARFDSHFRLILESFEKIKLLKFYSKELNCPFSPPLTYRSSPKQI